MACPLFNFFALCFFLFVSGCAHLGAESSNLLRMGHSTLGQGQSTSSLIGITSKA